MIAITDTSAPGVSHPPLGRIARHALALATAALVGACAQTPSRPAPLATQPPPPPTEVYFYPAKGQSPAQQDRDRYECYRWAVKQTGFDPSAPRLAPHQQLKFVASPPPGHDTAAGAVAGAIIGAVVSPPNRTAEGAAVGAVAGAVAGAASDAARQQQAERLQERADQRNTQAAARLEQQAHNYRRAMAACLEGRGYSIR